MAQELAKAAASRFVGQAQRQCVICQGGEGGGEDIARDMLRYVKAYVKVC